MYIPGHVMRCLVSKTGKYHYYQTAVTCDSYSVFGFGIAVVVFHANNINVSDWK